MVEELVGKIPIFQQWIGSRGDSEHHPIFLELKGGSKKPGNPFKFNPCWLNEDNYIKLIKEKWVPLDQLSLQSVAHQFMENLKKVK